MIIRTLEHTSLDTIIDCFIESFRNYFVELSDDPSYYRQRWQTAGLKWDTSYGMFDKDRLVGFIFTAIDERDGQLSAYNSGTGVIPEYRGKRIVQSIYETAIPEFRKLGVTRCILEVIKANERAIKAYQNVGFEITRSYKCYGGSLNMEPDPVEDLEEVSFDDLDWQSLPNQDLYAWESHWKCLQKGEFRYFRLGKEKLPESFFVMNQDLKYMPQLDIVGTDSSRWERLFRAIRSMTETVSINNVDETLIHKNKALIRAGLDNTVDQHEMELDISG